MIDQRAYLRDCMDAMAEFPDKFFDLAVVDPPYGIGMDNPGYKTSKYTKYKKANWDNAIPNAAYFAELFRVSQHQIVWGGNYFTEHLPPSAKWIVWDKNIAAGLSFGMHELAWSSFDKMQAKICRESLWKHQNNQWATRQTMCRIHPTQKPIALYDWIFSNYAKAGQKVLDTHLGSGSSRIAANKAGIDFWGYELDADYFAAHEKRYANFISQLRMF
jgi:site-specific DNA-methyltransferase (adenine-specific)